MRTDFIDPIDLLGTPPSTLRLLELNEDAATVLDEATVGPASRADVLKLRVKPAVIVRPLADVLLYLGFPRTCTVHLYFC